jgi:hypothetical protein
MAKEGQIIGIGGYSPTINKGSVILWKKDLVSENYSSFSSFASF